VYIGALSESCAVALLLQYPHCNCCIIMFVYSSVPLRLLLLCLDLSLQYHSVDFFTDINELSTALTSYSDADLFVAAQYSATGNVSSSSSSSSGSGGADVSGDAPSTATTGYPGCYARCLTARAAAAARRRAAPSRMRTFTAPPVFALQRATKSAAAELRAYIPRLWESTGALWTSGRHSNREIYTELIPTVRPSKRLYCSFDLCSVACASTRKLLVEAVVIANAISMCIYAITIDSL
jgi:hypothetical protein